MEKKRRRFTPEEKVRASAASNHNARPSVGGLPKAVPPPGNPADKATKHAVTVKALKIAFLMVETFSC